MVYTNLQAVRFVDLQTKDFILTCSTAIPGLPRKTKCHGLVQHPQVAEQYLKHAAAIDVHNHFRSGSCALEDVWHTKKRCRQLAGILGFYFTNGYLAMKHFSDLLLPHFKFKMTAAAALTTYKLCSIVETRSLLNVTEEPIQEHPLLKISTSTCAITIRLDAKEQNFLQHLNVVFVTSLSASLAKGTAIMNILKGYLKKSGLAKTSLEKMTEYSVILV